MMMTNPPSIHRLLPGLVFAALGLACASSGGGSSGGIPDFPSQGEINSIIGGETEPAPYVSTLEPGVLVDGWTLKGPLPDQYGPVSGWVPKPTMARVAGARPGIEPSPELACLARELGLFIATRGSKPQALLSDFMAMRCGWTSTQLQWQELHWSGTVSAEQIATQATAALSGGADAFGLWHGEVEGGGVLVVVQGQRTATLDPMPMAAPGTSVSLTGTMGARGWLQGFITHGKYGANTCRNVPTDRGRFHLACPVRSQDSGAVIEVIAARPGRLLGHQVLRVWVSPDGTLSPSYARLQLYNQPKPIPANADIGALLVTTTNDLRAALDFGPITLAPAQTQEFERVAPHIGRSMAAGDDRRLDQLMLGLLGGWKLPTQVLSGDIGYFRVEQPRDRRDILAAALASPYRRYVLLDPARKLIALDVLGEPGQVREVLLGTWQPLPSGHQTSAEDRVMRLVEFARKAKQLPGPKHVGGPVHQALAQYGPELTERRPSSVLDDVLQTISSGASSIPVRGMVLFSQDLDDLEVPDELLEADGLQLGVHVEILSSPRSRWGTIAVMFAYVYDRDLS